MNLIPFINRYLLYALAFWLTLSGVALAESQAEFTINGKPVPRVVATVNGTKLTSDLLKREMIAYRLLTHRQGKTMKTEDEEKIAQGLLMKAIDDELISSASGLLFLIINLFRLKLSIYFVIDS